MNSVLQGSADTKLSKMLDGLTIRRLLANFVRCICAKNCEIWLTVNRVIGQLFLTVKR